VVGHADYLRRLAEVFGTAAGLTRTLALREYADNLGHAGARSVTVAPTAGSRLRGFAGHLDLDWVTRRCAELGQDG
jgi:hypothetical protein